MPKSDPPKPQCFLSLPRSRPYTDEVVAAVRDAAESAGFEFRSQNDFISPSFGSSFTEAAKIAIAESDCVVADVTEGSSSVASEIGLAEGMGVPVLIIADDDQHRALEERSSFVLDFPTLRYEFSSQGLRRLREQLRDILKVFRDSPRKRLAPPSRTSSFFIDWDRLDRSEEENLCRELMIQMGFLQVNWVKHSPEIDIIAELPKRDPDGFEYRELWLVAMGRNAPIEMILEMSLHDPEIFWDRFLRRSDAPESVREYRQDMPLTLLVVTFTDSPELSQMIESQERKFKRRNRYGRTLRIRHWDRSYLTALVQQHPQLGNKYFSDEARLRSKYRKTYEELYLETVTLNNQLEAKNKALEDEKNARVRAERDAVWKDISFAAAHRLGNPIFAIETNLDPLDKRIKEGDVAGAVEVANDIRISIGKSKSIIEQFKSLTKAQNIHAEGCKLKPILETLCRPNRDSSVKFSIRCADSVTLMADPERISEVFDELVANSLKWLGKRNGEISINVTSPFQGPLPAVVDSSKRYALIHFVDNGPGVPLEKKERIFDAFFTTDDHGTGLGLGRVFKMI